MDLAIITRFLNGFLMITLPILLGIYLTNRWKLSWKIWLIGGVTFILSQVLHIPFNSYVLNPILGNLKGGTGNWVVAISLGLSAGIFEECARYGMFRWWLKDKHTWRTAILAGVGHGGAEAIIFGALVLWSFANMLVVRNADLTTLFSQPLQLFMAHQQVQAYWQLPWYDTLFGALERIFTIPFHIMASILVVQVFTRKPGHPQLAWLGLAILLHTLMDASAVFIAAKWSGYATEAVLGGLAIIDIFIIFALRQPEPEPTRSISPPALNPPPVFTPKPIEETTENLDKTRFQ
jgi:uncharacterized membrane protein YhfC